MGGGGELLEAGGGEGVVGLPADVAGRVDEEDIGGVGGGGGGVVGELLPGGLAGGEGEEVGLEEVGDLFADAAKDEGADEGGSVLEEGHVVVVDGGGGGEVVADGLLPGGGGVGGVLAEAEDENGGGSVKVAGEGDGVAVECGAGGSGDGGQGKARCSEQKKSGEVAHVLLSQRGWGCSRGDLMGQGVSGSDFAGVNMDYGCGLSRSSAKWRGRCMCTSYSPWRTSIADSFGASGRGVGSALPCVHRPSIHDALTTLR